ncbi:MAG: helix-turn-helix transcriptional regulator [Planctomycetota bacterium]
MGSQGRPRVKPEAEEMVERIEHLHQILYRRNQRLLADATGVSQSFVSKILGRSQQPSQNFLDALARQPLVNPAWLFRGEGEPLLPVNAGTLPIANVILPGSPREYPGMLTGMRLPVAAGLDRDTRYGLPLAGYWSDLLQDRLLMSAADTLIIESDRAFLDRPDVVGGRLCTVRIAVETGDFYALAKISIEYGALFAELFLAHELAVKSKEPLNSNPPQQDRLSQFGQPDRMKISQYRQKRPREDDEDLSPKLPTPTAKQTHNVPATAIADTLQPAEIQDVPHHGIGNGKIRLPDAASIVGVALKLERPLLLLPGGKKT